MPKQFSEAERLRMKNAELLEKVMELQDKLNTAELMMAKAATLLQAREKAHEEEVQRLTDQLVQQKEINKLLDRHSTKAFDACEEVSLAAGLNARVMHTIVQRYEELLVTKK